MTTRRTGLKALSLIAAALSIGMAMPAHAQSYPAPQPLKAGAQASLDSIKFAGGTPTIAYLPMGTEFNYHLALYEGMKMVPGIKHFILSPYSGGDQAGQMGMLQEVTSRKDVDAILIISFDEHSLAPLVKKAVDAGKVVVIINSDIRDYPTPVHGVIGVNQRDANHKLYDWAKEQLGDAPRKVAVLEGQPGYLNDELQESPWIQMFQNARAWCDEVPPLSGHP